MRSHLLLTYNLRHRRKIGLAFKGECGAERTVTAAAALSRIEPQQIPCRSRPPAATIRYSYPLEQLPAGTAEVSVKAVDGTSP